MGWWSSTRARTGCSPPSLDVANLVAHLYLRGGQGLVTERRVSAAATAFLDGYGGSEVDPRRFAAYLASARLRLAAVYSFRQPRPGLTDRLLAQAAAVRPPGRDVVPVDG